MRRAVLVVVLAALVGCGEGAPSAGDAGDAGFGDVALDHGAAVDAVTAHDAGTTEDVRVVAPCDASSADSGVWVRGHAFPFGPAARGTEGAVVRVLEHPERCATVAADGAFALGGFAAGESFSLTMDHLDYAPIQTGTHVVPAEGMERVTFQAPTWTIYRLMANAARVAPLPDRCQIATTVTEVGRSLYSPDPSHGEAGATVTIAPQPEGAVGPIYFDYLERGVILPDRRLTQTTRDGGVLWLNVPPGEYVLTAHKAGVRFTQARFRCRAGVLVNASPPWGLQALP